MTEPGSNHPAPRHRLVRRIRMPAAILLGLLLPLAGFYLVLNSSWFLTIQLEKALASKVDAEVSIDRADLVDTGRLQVSGVTIRRGKAPGDEILHLDRLAILGDFSELASGRVRVDSVQVDRVVIWSGALHHDLLSTLPEGPLDGLPGTDEDTEASPGFSFPEVTIDRLEVVAAERRPGNDGSFPSLRFTGTLGPSDLDPRIVVFDLLERLEGDHEGMQVAGEVSLVEAPMIRAVIERLPLAERVRRICPEEVRNFWDRMQPQGTIENARIEWRPGAEHEDERLIIDVMIGGVGVTREVSGFEFTIPIPSEEWVRFRDGGVVSTDPTPRMEVATGRLSFEGTRLEMNGLTGHLGSDVDEEGLAVIPYTLDLSIDLSEAQTRGDDAPLVDLFESVGFEMTYETRDFRFIPESTDRISFVDLPMLVGRILEQFHVTEGVLTTRVVVSREPPGILADGTLVPAEIVHRGRIAITGASARYVEFPYDLHRVAALLKFDNDRVTVMSFHGIGSHETRVGITGTIEHPGRGSTFRLDLEAVDMPLDGSLREALPETHRKIFDELFAFQGSGEGVTSGGDVQLDLSIARGDAPGDSIEITGLVDFDRIQFVPQKFGYPIVIGPGALMCLPDRIEVVPPESKTDVIVRSAGGGFGSIVGAVHLSSGEDLRARPDFQIEILNDEINDRLLAAIEDAVTSTEDAADSDDGFLEDLQLGGVLNYAVGIEPGKIAVVVKPKWITAMMRDRPIRLDRRDGLVRVDEGGVHLKALILDASSGGRGEGQITLEGVLAPSDSSRRSSLEGTWNRGDFQSPLIAGMLDRFGASDVADTIMQLAPSGRFDATMSYDSDEESPRYELDIMPSRVALTLREREVSVNVDAGHVVIGPDLVEINDLMTYTRDGAISVDGAIRLGDATDGSLSFHATGNLQSSTMTALLTEKVTEALDAIEYTQGETDATLEGTLVFGRVSPGAEWITGFDGTLHVDGASITSGIAFRDIAGAFDIAMHSVPGSPPALDIEARIERMTMFDREVSDVDARVVFSEDGRHLHLDPLTARFGDGRLLARARIGMGAVDTYHLNVQVVGTSLGTFASDPSPRPEGSVREGIVDASLRVVGRRGHQADRVGRGRVRIADGRISAIPLTLRLTQVLQLSFAPGSDVNSADVRFYLDGETLVFERLILTSREEERDSLTFLGEGTMDFQTLDLDVTLHTRSSLSNISELLGRVSDRLYAISVTGPLGDPEVVLVPLPGLR